MRKRRSVVLGIASIGSLAIIACGSGTGALSTIDDGYDRPPNTRENPGTTREAPGTTGRDTPPTSGDNPGTQGGGPTGGGTGVCPPCDQRFTCVNIRVTNGQTETDTDDLTLRTASGGCSAGEGVILDCSGQVTVQGQTIGTWQSAGAGFTASVTVEGRTQTISCVPRSGSSPEPQPDPVPGTPGTGTGNGTTPIDAGNPVDAGIGG